MTEFTDELKRLDLAINLPSKTYFAIEEKFKDWQPPKPPKPLVEVPRIMADFIKTLKIRCIKPLMDSVTFREIDFTEEKRDEILHWINEHQEEYMRAWLDGYTVKKEQLYHVKFPKTVGNYLNLITDTGDVLFGDKEEYANYKTKFTEQEIKDIDLRYCAFAVKVEEA